MRQQWAVTAAGHQLEAIRAIQSAGRDIDAELALQWADMAYSSLIHAIGTVPGSARVVELTVERGMSTDALEAVRA
jgi:hypothetical protein